MGHTKDRQQVKKFLLVISLFTIVAGAASVYRSTQIGALEYIEHLDDEIAVINDKTYPLRDIAVYIGYQEMQVEEQAKVYDLEDTNKYWNVRGKNAMIRTAARETTLDMFIHDIIFYEMAVENNIELTAEEQCYMENQQMDFWSDLEDEGQERIGIVKEEIEEQFYRMALAQKMQQQLADNEGVDYREYTIGGDSYDRLLESNTCKINEELWKRLRFGNIVLDPKR